LSSRAKERLSACPGKKASSREGVAARWIVGPGRTSRLVLDRGCVSMRRSKPVVRQKYSEREEKKCVSFVFPTFEPQAASYEFRIRGRSGNCVLREERSRMSRRSLGRSVIFAEISKDDGRPANVPLDAQAMKVRYVSGVSIYKTRERLVRMLLP